ncbi:DUF3343 domain-containing protein [Gallicola sp. Sow4_E12]|uniref:DUF3343 domain-containing protein n=1 Tax=Gallicola sp. Sow4_E12 TaxID=3438785 RepID=UPI003F930D79
MDSLHYILFNNVKEATSAYEYLKEKGFRLTLAPTPRKASKCCGVCVLSKNSEEFKQIKGLLEKDNIPHSSIYETENDFDPTRNKFC